MKIAHTPRERGSSSMDRKKEKIKSPVLFVSLMLFFKLVMFVLHQIDLLAFN